MTFGYSDILHPFRYESGMQYNSGDLVYYLPGVSFFFNDLPNIEFYNWHEVKQKLANDCSWAKKKFCYCINMHANFFQPSYKETLKEFAQLYNQLGIPVYLLGVGAQSTIDYDESILESVKDEVKMFVDAIIQSGGDLTVRGDFTKYFLEKIGFSNIFVSGCPSLFYSSRNLSNFGTGVLKEDFNPCFNGEYVSSIPQEWWWKYDHSKFYDQGCYWAELYNADDIKSYNRHLWPFRKVYAEGRLEGDLNYFMWKKSLLDNAFNFSYGSRIHGNIIALQNGIPAFVKVTDSRTREIAECFKIPNSIQIPFDEEQDDLYELYTRCDYTSFSEQRLIKQEEFKNFLGKHGIKNNVGESEKFDAYYSSLDYYDYRNDSDRETVLKTICGRFPGQ